jgi:hypothetical protein
MSEADKFILVELQKEHHELLQRLIAANNDLEERVHQLGLDVFYDHDTDELLCIIGKPVEAATVSIDNMLFFRYDVETLKIVGFGILGLRVHRGKNELLDRIAAYVLTEPGMAAQAARALALV